MQVLEVALKREQEAEAYYRELAGKTQDAGLGTILRRLADAEVRHQRVIQAMQQQGMAAEAADPAFLAECKKLFAKMAEEKAGFAFDLSQVDMYRHAQQREQESRALYTQAAESAGDAATRGVFTRLASQEKMHDQILGSIIEFVQRSEPGRWLENAEWYHSDEY
jgi:rubrerythrin